MQFSQIISFALVAVSSVAALSIPSNASSQGSCSTGVAQCCGTVQSGTEAKQTIALLGLNDVFGDIGLSCNQLPINAVGGSAAISNSCKNSAVCCTGSHANGLIQASCTPLSIN